MVTNCWAGTTYRHIRHCLGPRALGGKEEKEGRGKKGKRKKRKKRKRERKRKGKGKKRKGQEKGKEKRVRDLLINKVGYTATKVACRWAGAIFKVIRQRRQEQ